MEEEWGGSFVVSVDELGVTGLWTTIKDVSWGFGCVNPSTTSCVRLGWSGDAAGGGKHTVGVCVIFFAARTTCRRFATLYAALDKSDNDNNGKQTNGSPITPTPTPQTHTHSCSSPGRRSKG